MVDLSIGNDTYQVTVDEVTYDISVGTYAISGAINDLTDVDTSGVSDGQLLSYEAATSTWKPVTASGTGDMTKAVYDTDNDGVVDNAEALGGSTLAQVLAAGGAVSSVNTQTGAVVLDADDIDDSATTNKFVTAADLTNLSNLSGTNTGDQDLSGYLLSAVAGSTYAAVSHTHTESDITDLDKYDTSTVDSLLSAKLFTSTFTNHTHTESDITDLQSYLLNINGESLADLGDVTITTVADNEVLAYNAATSTWVNQTAAEAGLATAAQGALADSALQSGDNISVLTNDSGFTTNTGTVTSVAQTVPTGFAISGSPVTSTGTLAITYDTGYQGYTTAEASKLSGIEAGADVTDATNVVSALSGATLSGNLAVGDNHLTGVGTVGFTQELDNGSKTTSFSIDFGTDQKQKVTLTANTMTLTLDTTFDRVGNYLLKIVNGGLATLTWASETGSVYWAGGTAPTLTSSGTDIVSFYYDGTNWYGVASLAFA